MTRIKKESVKTECKDIGKQRNCPTCNRIIYYKNEKCKCVADKHGRSCKKCLNEKLSILYRGTKLPDSVKKKISKSLKGRKKSKVWKSKIRDGINRFNKNHPGRWAKENNPMFGVSRFGKKNPNFGKKWTPDQLEKAIIRGKKQYLIRLRKLGILKIGFNPRACKYFDYLSKKNGWNLQHALNGGEVMCETYFLDAYDKKRNIVVEYDESHHFTSSGKLKKKDRERQKRIVKNLGCRFYRFNERIRKLVKVI